MRRGSSAQAPHNSPQLGLAQQPPTYSKFDENQRTISNIESKTCLGAAPRSLGSHRNHPYTSNSMNIKNNDYNQINTMFGVAPRRIRAAPSSWVWPHNHPNILSSMKIKHVYYTMI